MEHYTLQPDEVVLFEDNISFSNGASKELTLTNLNLVIVSTTKRLFKPSEYTVNVYPLSDIKVYNGVPQVIQKRENVTIYLTSQELLISFPSVIKAARFTSKATNAITGKSIAARGAGKVKNALGLVDETLGIDTMGTITGVLENGISKTLFKGFGDKVKTASEKTSTTANTISSVAGTAAKVLQETAKQEKSSAPPHTEMESELSYEQRVESVKKLKELLDVGILSQEEFDAKKKELLGL